MPQPHPQVLRDDARHVRLSAVGVHEHQLAHAGAVHRFADLVPDPHQRPGAERERAGERGVLVALADLLRGQNQHARRRDARQRGIEHRAADAGVDVERQVRPVLLDRRDRQHGDRALRIERGEVFPGQRGPAAMERGHGVGVRRRVRRAFSILVAVAALALAPARAAEPVAVEFLDASRPTRCAEEDNVYVQLRAPGIARFRIVGEHPPYIGAVTVDSTAPDFTDCDMSKDPVFRFVPTRVVLHEDASLRVVGHRYETFWRPGAVPMTVGGRRADGMHLVQLVRRGPEREVEMLVLYPSDGYWRLKPAPPGHLPDTAYGSSFLVGPVEERGRPFVALRRIDLDPATLTFRLVFGDGSRGSLRIAEWSPRRVALAVELDRPVRAGRPFAALRSMYVRVEQADASVVEHGAGASRLVAPILGFGRVVAPRARFGRDEPSMHNLSAPDVVFEGFEALRR
jgi:hypothetical protein